MGFGDFVDGVGDAFEDGIDSVKSTVGSAVDGGAHLLGDGLDAVGLHGAAQAVDSFGDSVADSLGAQVGEYQLGESDDPKDLVHGDVEGLGESVKHLRRFQAAFEQTGQGLSRLDADHWKGAAGDAFRAKFAPQPKLWLTAADACRAAADAMDGFAHTVSWAQDEAQQAIDLYKAAKKASEQARDAYDKNVDRYNQAAQDWNKASQDGKDPGPRPTDPGDFQDPGVAGLKQAQEKLRTARGQRDTAAGTAQAAVDAATATAPAEPSFTSRMGSDLSDTFQGAMVGQLHLAGGLVKGAADIVKFGRGLNPTDPYNLTHPAQYADHVSTTAAGLLHASNHPMELLSAVVGSGWSSDPFEAFGKLTTNVAFGVVTGGAGEAGAVAEDVALNASKNVAENAAKDVGENATKNAARDAAENAARKDAGQAARDAAENPSKEARKPNEIEGCGDPVDVATGEMFLRQTDLGLPGSLPLFFERSHTSAHRSGLWMGPTWACTADERLVVDAEGVLLLRPDGGMLVYPHPVPGVATLPVSGSSRWPLVLDTEGRYRATDPLSGLTRTYLPEPDDPGTAPLSEIRDRAGRWIALDHDDAGAPVSIRHHGGYHLKLTVEGGRITALHLAGAGPDGGDTEIVRYGYTDGHLTQVTNSSGLPQRFDYDAAGRMTAWTDRNGSRYAYAYDHLDRCVDQGGAEGHLRYHYDYDQRDPGSGHRITAATDSLGHTRRYLIDGGSRIVAETDPLGATTQYTYDRHGRRLSVTDPLGATVTLTYDEAGNPATATRPDGTQSLVSYGDLNLPLAVMEPDGTTWRQSYDAAGNRTTLTDPTGATTRFGFDASGNASQITDALGHVSTLRCNAAGLLTESVDPLGGRTGYLHDAFGRPTAITDALGNTTRYTWSVEGLLTSRTTPDGSVERWTYDGEGNTLTHTDHGGAVTTMEYSHFDLLAARTGADGARHTFTHDSELRLVRVTGPQGLSWSYEHDAAGRVTAETDFNGRTIRYAHDPAGRVTGRTNSLGETIGYRYDLVGNLSVKDAAGRRTTYGYDRAGRLTSANSPGVALVRRYDQLGQVVAETVNGRTLTTEYDVLGRRSRRRTPSGAESSWSYDAAGSPASLTASGHVLGFEHDALGRETGRRLGPDLTLSHTWDSVHRLTSQTVTSSARALQHRAYTYRADGNLTGICDLHDGTRSFDLDDAGRVTAVHAANWTERYVYDAAGNITDAQWPDGRHDSGRGPRTYRGTLISTAGRIRYDHDSQGRITVRRQVTLSGRTNTWHYTWDAEDRLTEVTTPDGTRWQYLYDAFGRRIAKQRLAEDGVTVAEWTDFTWDGSTLAEQTAHGPALPGPYTLTWDHDGLRPLAQTEHILLPDAPQDEIDRRFFAVVTDLIGTPTHLLDADGTPAWQARTTLWGATEHSDSRGTTTPLRFPGQYYDPETRLHYNLHRYYDPITARYATLDPLGLAAAPNPQAYIQNPHTWADPFGLAPCKLSDRAKDAIEKFHNLMKDPIGEINGTPNHNHYNAARREAAGEVVARKPDGTPFSHISDLQQARDGLLNVKKALHDEFRFNKELTDRDVQILKKYQAATEGQLGRLNRFLHGIGHGTTPPYHAWPPGS
ncbi:putative T7SS-secreted protein [Kitasatospora herbaricolor]|uniref:putative T7SS-secreted protein n=1 Tax=Kitasatospora herbaricolor TaxID=68217 RepID=UPI0036D77E8B